MWSVRSRQVEEYHVFNFFFDEPPGPEPGIKILSFQRQYDSAGREVWEAAGDRTDPDPVPNPPPAEPDPKATPLTVRYVEQNVHNPDGTIAQRRIEDRVDDDETDPTPVGVWDYTYDGLNRQLSQDYARGDGGTNTDSYVYGYDPAGRMNLVSSNGNTSAEIDDVRLRVTADYGRLTFGSISTSNGSDTRLVDSESVEYEVEVLDLIHRGSAEGVFSFSDETPYIFPDNQYDPPAGSLSVPYFAACARGRCQD